jgi:catechol 2,3-dioxygenase-like lactoylglutathione lyase family enzyme
MTQQAINQYISKIAILVKDYDEAIEYYTEALGFNLVEDMQIGEDQRWVVVAPPSSNGIIGTQIILMRATTDTERNAIGKQAGGAVLLILQTDDFWRDYQSMKTRGVVFHEEPRKEPYGTVVIFEDLYGNKWDLIEPVVANS